MAGMSQEQEFCSRGKGAALFAQWGIVPTPALTAAHPRDLLLSLQKTLAGTVGTQAHVLRSKTPNLIAFRSIGNVLKVVYIFQYLHRGLLLRFL